MTTFLPHPGYRLSAKCLDTQRLGNQRGECLAVLQALLGKKVYPGPCGPTIKDWDDARLCNHPCARMWEDNIISLAIYSLEICDEWRSLGYMDVTRNKIELLVPGIRTDWLITTPSWLGNEAFHASHRSNLLRKDEKFYRRLGWTEPTNLPYVWPRSTC